MTTRPIDLLLTLDVERRTLDVDNRTAGTGPTPLTIGPELPLRLRIEADQADVNNAVRVVVEGDVEAAAQPYEPPRPHGGDVLVLTAAITDAALGTQDDTRWQLTVVNRSQHFAAERIRVAPRLDPRCGAGARMILPDGNPIFEIVPCEQEIRCLAPGQQHELTFVVITRGPAAGTYGILVELAYTLYYWERRAMQGVSLHAIEVSDRCPTSKSRCDC